jgi:hypothetical protein
MSPKQPFSLGKRTRYPIIFLVVVTCLIAGILLLVPSTKQPDFFLPAVAASAGFAYFLYTQHLQETKLFSELFRQFNERYDTLNGELNRIATAQNVSILDQDSKQVLFDYFNLCAEEYLYYKTGFIDPEVWRSWASGMGYFASVQHIRDIWTSELGGGSYYGFTLHDLGVKT